jgi:putative ABC transport system ATP-binding protein
MPLIHLEDVNKVFVTDDVETHALSGIHLDIEQGEFVSIAGPSGCGKSTLLAILGLLDSPSRGQYWLNGKTVEQLGANQRARIRNQEVGFIFQAFNLIGDLNVRECGAAATYRRTPASERKQRVHGARAGGDVAPQQALSQPASAVPAACVARAPEWGGLHLLADEPREI